MKNVKHALADDSDFQLNPCLMLYSAKGKNKIIPHLLILYNDMHRVFLKFFILTQGHLFFIAFKERGRKRERTINVREKHWLVVSHMHPDWRVLPTWAEDCVGSSFGSIHPCLEWESNPQPRYVPWRGIEPATFQLWGNGPIHWATLGRAICRVLRMTNTIRNNVALFTTFECMCEFSLYKVGEWKGLKYANWS